MSSRLTAYLLLLTASIIWGIAGPVIKYSVSVVSPLIFLFWRLLFVSLITLPIFLWYTRKHPIPRSAYKKLLVVGVLNAISLIFVFLGFARTTAIEGTLITAITPIFIVAAGVFFLREHVSRRELAGIILAIAGTVFTVLQPLLGQGLGGSSALAGNVLLLGYGVTWMGIVLLSKFWGHEGLKPFHIASTGFFIGLFVYLPLAMLKSGGLPSAAIFQNTGALYGLTYLVILSSLVAYTTYHLGLSKIEAGEADIFNYLQPVWAAPLALFWLGETITPTFLVGAVLIAAGVAIAEYRPGLFRRLLLTHKPV